MKNWYMRKRIHHWFSVVREKSQPSGPSFSRKLGKLRLQMERWSLRLGFFYPHWTPMMDSIFLAYLYQSVGKIKKQTAARRSDGGRTSIHDVIVMLKWRHYVTYQRIQNYLEAFFMYFQHKMRYLVVSKRKNPLFVWGWDRKIRPSRSPFVTIR